MTRVAVLQLSSGPPRAVADAQVLALADVREPRKLRALSPLDELAIVGAPPGHEIGAALAPFVAAVSRARRVRLIDERTGNEQRQTLLAYLAAAVGPAGVQLVVSLGAVVAQRVVAELLRAPVPSRRRGDLRRLVYLRPHVGGEGGAGGGATHTHEVIRALKKHGVDVAAFTNDIGIARAAADDPEPACHWEVVRVPRAAKAIPASAAFAADVALVARALSAARRADVIYQRHSRFSLSGVLLSTLSRRPLLLEYNGSLAFFSQHWQPTPLFGQLVRCERTAIAGAHRAIVVAEAERRLLVASGITAGRIVVNPNGVDLAHFGHGGGAARRAELGITRSERVLGFVGSFGPWHGAPVLGEAFAVLSSRKENLTLLLVGDGPERSAAEASARAAGGRVVSIGRVPHSLVPSYLDACDVLISPHVNLPGGVEFFGSPTKLFEYMAAGRPLVASRLGQIEEVLEDGVNALLVPPGDVEALATALECVLDDPALSTQLATAARRDAATRHSWENNARRIIDTYNEMKGD